MPAEFKRLLFGLALAAAAAAGLSAAAFAQIPGDKIKIGVLSDFSGPFADQVGKGSLVGAELAAEDFAKEAGGLRSRSFRPITRITRHRGRDRAAMGGRGGRRRDRRPRQFGRRPRRQYPDARKEPRDARFRDRHLRPDGKILPAEHRPMGPRHLGARLGRRPDDHEMGGSTWYFISFEYALGKALQRDATEAIVKAGGAVLGSVSHPLGATDFGSYLLRAQASAQSHRACRHRRRRDQRDPPSDRIPDRGARYSARRAILADHGY